MNVIGVIQNTPEWLALRATCDTASEASAALGKSKYTSRTDLLKQKSTGIVEEVSRVKQALYDRGHAAEAAARSLAESLVNDDLYPITATLEIDGLKLLASLDGATMDEDIIFEHKLWSEELASQIAQGWLVPHYTIQMDQQLLVSGASKCLFMASDGTTEKMAWLWYESSPEKFANLIAGWKQFAIDLAAYVPTESAPVAVAKMASILPVVFDMRVEGKLVACNIDQYKPAALAYIKAINIALVTDQDFADADADAKYCRDSADKLELAIEQALAQMGDINAAMATVREIAAAFDAKGLALEKLVKSEKDNRKIAIISAGSKALQAHEAGLQERAAHYLPPGLANFGTVAKGLKKIDSIQNAVDTELARCKIEASATADKIQANLQTIAAAGHDYLFPDAGKLVLKAPDDLANTITARIADHQAKEAVQAVKPAAPVPVQPVPAPKAPVPAKAMRPTDWDIIEVLAANFQVHGSTVIEWLLEMDIGAVRRSMA